MRSAQSSQRSHIGSHFKIPDHVFCIESAFGMCDDIHLISAGLTEDSQDFLFQLCCVCFHGTKRIYLALVHLISLNAQNPINAAPGFHKKRIPHSQAMNQNNGITGFHTGFTPPNGKALICKTTLLSTKDKQGWQIHSLRLAARSLQWCISRFLHQRLPLRGADPLQQCQCILTCVTACHGIEA